MKSNTIRYSVMYNEKTWQWSVVKWTRTDPLDPWQGRAVAGHANRVIAEAEAARLTRTIQRR